jgi:hypothetical protein
MIRAAATLPHGKHHELRRRGGREQRAAQAVPLPRRGGREPHKTPRALFPTTGDFVHRITIVAIVQTILADIEPIVAPVQAVIPAIEPVAILIGFVPR